MKTTTKIPKHLSHKSTDLWRSIEKRYALDEPAFALLATALEALDRLSEAREIIARDGLIIGEGAGAKRHPACDLEKQYASVFLRSWRDLGFDKTEGAQAVGRG